jgi:hypothetical protein
MKRGDLRRFRDDSAFSHADIHQFTGQTFLVLCIIDRVPGKTSGFVDILIDGGIQKSWGYPWVEQNSEAINEAR